MTAQPAAAAAASSAMPSTEPVSSSAAAAPSAAATDPATAQQPLPDAPGTENPASTGTGTSSTRLERTTAVLPVVYGSIAFYLGKKADEFQTHEWTLYVRGPNDEDLSPVVSKVVFQLHASFAQPVREYTSPPFEVTERGWGEFEAQIRIVWKDASEKPTIVNHGIKLYPPGSAPNTLSLTEDAPPVIAEIYDEVVFTDPNEAFYRNLMRISDLPRVESGQQEHLGKKVYDDQDHFLALIEAQKFLREELGTAKERFRVVSEELAVVDQTLLRAQQQQREAAAAAASKKTKASTQRKRPAPAKKAKT